MFPIKLFTIPFGIRSTPHMKTIYLIDTILEDRFVCTEAITCIDPTISIKNAGSTDEFLQLINEEGLVSPSIVIMEIGAIKEMTHLDSFLTLTNRPNVFPVIVSSYETNGVEDKILNCGALRFYSKPYSYSIAYGFFNELIADHLG